jgi:hypothetical protein
MINLTDCGCVSQAIGACVTGHNDGAADKDTEDLRQEVDYPSHASALQRVGKYKNERHSPSYTSGKQQRLSPSI